MPCRLLDECKVDIPIDQMSAKTVLQDMGVPLFSRKPRVFRNGLEDAKELRAIQPASLLAEKEET
jgi:hypothetical protein